MRVLSVIAVAGACAALASCGGSSGGSDSDMGSTPPKVPSVTQFPKVKGRSMTALAATLPAAPLIVAPSQGTLIKGEKTRFGFGLFDRTRKQITDAPGAIYISRGDNARALGPFVARWESLDVKGHYLSQTVATDPDAAKTLYVADLPFKKSGTYDVLGVFRLDNRLVGAGTRVKVSAKTKVPQVGDQAPRMTTPTTASVGGDISKIDTRKPHDDMHSVNYADAYGKKAIVLVFATPALCQSRVCGPVVDIAEQVKHDRPKDDVAWIHMEIYKDNQVNAGFRPQLAAFHLESEPWLFTINRKGRITAAIEGAYSASELNKAVDAALK
jgi:hypothetical protein